MTRKTAIAAITALGTVAAPALVSGFDPGELKTLRETRSCTDCDLRNAILVCED
jgi:hypothetical protein